MSLVYTKAYGAVEERNDREPAPLICEGECSVNGTALTPHEFSRCTADREGIFAVYRDWYRCTQCATERIWG